MPDEPPTTEIMRGTYQALCKHGYAEVTMEDIAAESTKSKASLHYYYESKHDLLLAFLDDLLGSFTERLDEAAGETPPERLLGMVDVVLEPREEDPKHGFKTAVLEMKAQGPYDDAFQERLTEFDRTLHESVAEALVAGVESGHFRPDLDVERTADFFVTVLNGAQTRSVAVGRSTEQTRETLGRYLESNVLAAEMTSEARQ